MPTFAIHYTASNNEKHDTEWITPTGWTADQAVACFQQRHPGTVVVSILDIGSTWRREAAALRP